MEKSILLCCLGLIGNFVSDGKSAPGKSKFYLHQACVADPCTFEHEAEPFNVAEGKAQCRSFKFQKAKHNAEASRRKQKRQAG